MHPVPVWNHPKGYILTYLLPIIERPDPYMCCYLLELAILLLVYRLPTKHVLCVCQLSLLLPHDCPSTSRDRVTRVTNDSACLRKMQEVVGDMAHNSICRLFQLMELEPTLFERSMGVLINLWLWGRGSPNIIPVGISSEMETSHHPHLQGWMMIYLYFSLYLYIIYILACILALGSIYILTCT